MIMDWGGDYILLSIFPLTSKLSKVIQVRNRCDELLDMTEGGQIHDAIILILFD